MKTYYLLFSEVGDPRYKNDHEVYEGDIFDQSKENKIGTYFASYTKLTNKGRLELKFSDSDEDTIIPLDFNKVNIGSFKNDFLVEGGSFRVDFGDNHIIRYVTI
jgi:hypothetical protein